MDTARFDNLLRTFSAHASRRGLLAGLASGLLAAGSLALSSDGAAARKKRKKNTPRKKPGGQARCLLDGSRCSSTGRKCTADNCLQPPFTIAARWSNPASQHDTFMFVPNAPGATLPSPYLDYGCRSAQTGAGNLYPFAFVDRDATGPGDEVTTVVSLLGGQYEYWIQVDRPAPSGELTVELRNGSSRVMRSWSSQPTTSTDGAWHVFDIEGSTRSVTSVDRQVFADLPTIAHNPQTLVCG